MDVPAQVLVLVQRVGDAIGLALGVVPVVGLSTEGVLLPKQIALAVIAEALGAPGAIGDAQG
jgi:hypothetical protein